MSKPTDRAEKDGTWGEEWSKGRLIPVSTLVLVIAITVGLYLVYGRHPEKLAELKNYAYWGAFLISLIGNATVIMPGAVLPILSGIAIVLYPVTGPVGPIFVGLVGGAGAAIGEITGYMAGYSGRSIVTDKTLHLRLVEWVRRWGVLVIFVFSIVPIFFDLAGIAAGILRFPLWKFVLVCWLGRTILYVLAALAVAWGWGVVFPHLS